MRIVGAILARNEADRYLEEVLTDVARFCDEIVVVDDDSADNTRDICGRWAAVHHAKDDSGGGFWGTDETNLRRLLWELASDAGGPDSWTYVFDADHLLTGITPDDFRTLCRAENINVWAFRLFDCWGREPYCHRTDGYWMAWRTPRPWLFRARPSKDFEPEWDTRGIHAGHRPANYPLCAGVAPGLAGIIHLGYTSVVDRAEKARKYLNLGVSE